MTDSADQYVFYDSHVECSRRVDLEVIAFAKLVMDETQQLVARIVLLRQLCPRVNPFEAMAIIRHLDR